MTWYDIELHGRYREHFRAVAGICTAVACLLSAHLIVQHWRHYRNVKRQRHIIRIIVMVPVYAVASFLSLTYIQVVEVSTFFDTLRDCYEAYVIYNFVALMIDYMGGDVAAHEFFMDQPPQPHVWPFQCLQAHEPQGLLRRVKICTLQYVLIKPLTALISVALYMSDIHDEGMWGISSPFLWIVILNNFSVSLALYYLVVFYHAAYPSPLFQAAQPFAKFLSVKAIVFFSFWQYTALLILAKAGVVRGGKAYDSDEIKVALDDFLICVEMAVAALAHHCVFSHHEHTMGFYQMMDDEDASLGVKTPLGLEGAVGDMFNVNDVVEELRSTKVHLHFTGKKKARMISEGFMQRMSTNILKVAERVNLDIEMMEIAPQVQDAVVSEGEREGLLSEVRYEPDEPDEPQASVSLSLRHAERKSGISEDNLGSEELNQLISNLPPTQPTHHERSESSTFLETSQECSAHNLNDTAETIDPELVAFGAF